MTQTKEGKRERELWIIFPMKLNLKPNNLARDFKHIPCFVSRTHFPGNLHPLPAVEVNTIDLSQVLSRVTTFNLEKLLPGEKIGWFCTSKKKTRNQDAHSFPNWTHSNVAVCASLAAVQISSCPRKCIFKCSLSFASPSFTPKSQMQALPGLTNRCLLVAHYGNYWPCITAMWKGLWSRPAQGHLQVVYLCWAIKNPGVIRSTTALWVLKASCSLTIWSFIGYLCDMFKHHLGP